MPPKKKGAKPDEDAEAKPAEKSSEKSAAAEKPAEEKTAAPAPAETPKPQADEKPSAPASEVKAGEEKPAGKAEETPAEEAPAEETPAEPEKPKELEQDAPPSKGPVVGAASVDMTSATLNVMPTAGGSVLMTLTDGGLQYLLASARMNTGVKSGRYLFEVKILESLNPAEGPGGKARAPAPRQLVRVGVSTRDSSVFLTDGADNVCFDSEGFFIHEKKKSKSSQKFGRDHVVGLLINCDSASPNANTMSLFRDGVRVSDPQPLPENLKGKPLFPTVTYRNVSIQINSGPEPLADLPFTCRMLHGAQKADVEVIPTPKQGKSQVVFPVGLPDTGVFDWADGFLEKNPTFTELSDRKILDWAAKSGLWRQKGYTWRASNDKPEMGFGIPYMDDTSVARLLMAIAPTLNRNYLVMELKDNLIAEHRAKTLKHFNKNFDKVATVVMGEPNSEYKALVQRLLLSEKQKKAEAEKKKKAVEAERKRLAAERQKKAEAAKRARLMAQKKDTDQADEQDEEAKDEEMKEESVVEEDVPAPELTEEEKKLTCRKLEAQDLLAADLAKHFADFSIPEVSEGFSSVNFEWQKEGVCKKLLQEYVHEKKMTQRVETLKPGEWFQEEWKKWQKSYQDLKRRQMEWKDPSKKKQLLAKKKEEAEKKAKESLGEDASKEDIEAACKIPDVNAEDVEVKDVQDVMDIGSGEPLFFNFAYEDWTLLSTRFELHLLAHAFRRDMDDPDRPGFVETHLAFYYNKYYKKQLNVKNYGVAENSGLVELIKETVEINSKNMLEAKLADDASVDTFVKVTEEHRRERQRRMDAGDETAQLKFTRPGPPQNKQQPAAGRGPQAPSHPPRRPAVQSSGYNNPPRHGASSYGAQKRTYSAPGQYPAAKAPRSYGNYGGGYRR